MSTNGQVRGDGSRTRSAADSPSVTTGGCCTPSPAARGCLGTHFEASFRFPWGNALHVIRPRPDAAPGAHRLRGRRALLAWLHQQHIAMTEHRLIRAPVDSRISAGDRREDQIQTRRRRAGNGKSSQTRTYRCPSGRSRRASWPTSGSSQRQRIAELVGFQESARI